MSKRKLLSVILLAFVTTLMLACAVIFTACGNNETPDDGQNTEQGGENPNDGDEPGTTPGTDPDDDKDIAVTSLLLDKTSLMLEVGESYTLVVTVSPNNATDKSITWSSTNSSVATVSGGKVTAKSEGATTITATAHNGKSVSCIVTVNEPAPEVIEVTSVSLNKTSLTLEIGESETLTATVLPSNATDKSVTWTSSAQTVVTVEDGKVTTIESGTATIIATTSNGKTASCSVTVNEPAPEIIEVTSVSLNKSSLALEIGESETLTATVLPSNATDKSVTWTSSDQAVAMVANGKVTAVGSGIATITATVSNGKTAICRITVNAAIPEITQVEGATIAGTDIFMLVDHMTDSVALLNKVTVSSGRWDLYSDILGQNRIPTKIAAGSNGKLHDGDNVFYIMLENENGDLAEVYTLTIYRSYAVTVSYYNHKDVLVYSDTAYTGYEYSIEFNYSVVGYTFHDWMENGTSYQPHVLWDGLSLYADMTANSYTVTLDANGGTISNSIQTVTYDETYAFPVPEREGYAFLGWYAGETRLADEDDGLSIWQYTDIFSVTAKWQIYQYTVNVEYDSKAGIVTGIGTYNYGTEISLMASSPNLGYNFLGWYDENDKRLTTEYIYSFTLGTDNLFFIAKYEVKEELESFTFTSTATTCIITGVKNKSVTDLIVPGYVTEIEEGAFSGCNSLTNVSLPFVGKNEFATTASSSTLFGYIFGTTSYTGGSATSQRYGSFSSVTYFVPTSLKNVTIIGGNILYGAFYNCSSLLSITIPDDIEIIGDDAFYGCSSLTSITIPDSVTSINGFAFSGCTSLEGVYITDIAAWCNIRFSYTSSNPLRYAGKLYLNNELITELIIPDNVTSIGNYAFYGCTSIESVSIPSSVTRIKGYAFSDCSSLQSVTLGEGISLYYISGNAFSDCTSLKSLTVQGTITSIHSQAFQNCTSLMNVYITDLDAWNAITFEDDTANPLYYGATLYLNGEEVTE